MHYCKKWKITILEGFSEIFFIIILKNFFWKRKIKLSKSEANTSLFKLTTSVYSHRSRTPFISSAFLKRALLIFFC